MRQFISVICISEVCFALSLGYEITELHELIIYQTEQLIFENLMKILSSFKIRNSISKSDYQNDVQLQEELTHINYEMNYLDGNEDLILTLENISLNPSKRHIFKTILNR